ncbi:RNA polymerase-associated protein RapA [Desulfosporosinus acididurans]|uniref:RNA polymerase-associated protein RapA n=1 Tax=Desulfosporosinus acididurans TaxID=476652 RepID=A0A0J1FRJ4_9FIRM|nr:DEAD/DEAH box helicase [Desulfosporosinus acididurans]KLU65603.1 RNA polymerase-associated protein RapA [Desulfosporosinus acididurans]
MPRFSISEPQIMKLADNDRVYKKGVSYFLTNRVRDCNYDPEKGTVSASVIGNLRYEVQLVFAKEGALHSYYCTCPAFAEYHGACKHVIAVLKTILQKTMSWSKSSKQNQAVEKFLQAFSHQQRDFHLEELTLNAELTIMTGYHLSADLQLKIGLQRLYVIKDLEQFLTALKTGQSLEFGKQFTFEPQRQTFKPEDQALVSMLIKMYEQHASLLEMQGSYYSSSLFKQRPLPLSGYYLTKFLDAMGNKEFLCQVNSLSPQRMRIVRDGLSLEFSLNSLDQDLSLTLESADIPLQLTADGSYYLYRQTIYQATTAQRDLLPSLISSLDRNAVTDIVIPAAQKETFVSESLPMIEKIGTVSIDPILEDKFSQDALEAKLFFDRSEDLGITARLEFHYGNVAINPFTSTRDIINNSADETILIRSITQERTILSILEQAEFIVSKGRIYLDDDDKIFQFIAKGLPLLQNLAEIYYSDQFKLKIRSAPAFFGQVRFNETSDILEISFQYNDIDPSELTDLFHSLHLKKKYHRLRDGSFLDLNQPELTSVAQLFDNLNLNVKDLDQKLINIPKYRAMYIDSFLRQANLPGMQRNKAFKQLVQSVLEPQDGDYEIPAAVSHVLRDYQKTGFQWLKTLAACGLGGILADDMGLGKTLQILSFILSEKEASPDPALVIAPTSLIYNWQTEAQKFTPSLKILVIDGTPQERQAQIERIGQWDLVVISYPIIRREIDNLKDVMFSYCFLDEAQHIKNSQTLNAKSVQQIQAKGYFALTGTPIENSLSELWSLFNFIMPGYLLTYPEFRQKFEIPIAKGEDTPLTELSRHVNPFILRRLKKDVLKELPDKIETQLYASLTEEQKKLYLAYLQEAKGQIAQELAAVGFNKSHIKILAALTRLRQICGHPATFLDDYAGESGKMLLLQEILTDALGSGHRILLFSQFTTMLNLIQKFLNSQNIEHFYLSGATKAAERLKMANSFNAGTGQVFLISLKAGGTGLNLIGADMVIHYDPWWNPAVEDQATDRAHRIGQKNSVQVIRLITQGTVEEKISALQAKKKALVDSVIQPGETFLSKLSEEELKELFDLS